MIGEWYVLAIGSMLLYAVGVLLMRRMLHRMDPYLATKSLISGLSLVYGAVWLFNGAPIPPQESYLFLLSIIVLAAIGNVADMTSVKLAPNPGFAGTIKAMQGIFIIAVSAAVTIGVSFSWYAFLFALIIVSGVIGISITGASKQVNLVRGKHIPWQVYGLVTLFCYSIMLVLFREIIAREYMDSATFLAFMWSGTAILLLLWSRFKHTKREFRFDGKVLLWFFAIVMVYSGANILEFVAAAIAPNPGYASAIKGSQIMVISLIAPLLFKEVTLNKKQFFFILLVVVGVAGLALV